MKATVKIEAPPPKTYILEVNQEEAEFLMNLGNQLSGIGGINSMNALQGLHYYTFLFKQEQGCKLYDALSKVGVKIGYK